MDHFAGLDVSVKETSLCIVDGAGRIVREVRIASEPEALLAVLTNPAWHFKRIGLEAGPLSQWLFSALAEAGLPVICVETRHMRAVLKAQINKTTAHARGIAQMMRAGLYGPVHVKTLGSQKLRMLLTHRKLLQSKAIAIENDLRATLRNFGLKVGVVGPSGPSPHAVQLRLGGEVQRRRLVVVTRHRRSFWVRWCAKATGKAPATFACLAGHGSKENNHAAECL